MWKALRIEALADTIAAEPAARLAENRLDIGRRHTYVYFHRLFCLIKAQAFGRSYEISHDSAFLLHHGPAMFFDRDLVEAEI
jgi:hypothetical protein